MNLIEWDWIVCAPCFMLRFGGLKDQAKSKAALESNPLVQFIAITNHPSFSSGLDWIPFEDVPTDWVLLDLD